MAMMPCAASCPAGGVTVMVPLVALVLVPSGSVQKESTAERTSDLNPAEVIAEAPKVTPVKFVPAESA